MVAGDRNDFLSDGIVGVLDEAYRRPNRADVSRPTGGVDEKPWHRISRGDRLRFSIGGNYRGPH
jgi:hypothetical protein